MLTANVPTYSLDTTLTFTINQGRGWHFCSGSLESQPRSEQTMEEKQNSSTMFKDMEGAGKFQLNRWTWFNKKLISSQLTWTSGFTTFLCNNWASYTLHVIINKSLMNGLGKIMLQCVLLTLLRISSKATQILLLLTTRLKMKILTEICTWMYPHRVKVITWKETRSSQSRKK